MFPLKSVLCMMLAGTPMLSMGQTPYEFDGRVGSVTFLNTQLYPIPVYIYHADTGRRYPDNKTSWTVEGQKSITLKLRGSEMHIGNDWGIRLGSSPMKCLGNASTWDVKRRQFTVTPESYFAPTAEVPDDSEPETPSPATDVWESLYKAARERNNWQ